MKPWQLNRRVDSLSKQLADPTETQTKIAFNSLSEPERQLLDKVQEIIDKYAPAETPQDIIYKYRDLWVKSLEIFLRRVTELFVDVVPASFCCDELEEWYFKLHFYNFGLDWVDVMKKLREMPKEQHQALLLEYKEMGVFDKIFRFPKNRSESAERKVGESEES